MGGHGSGRKPDLVKRMQKQASIASLGGQELNFPNYSGVQEDALKTSSNSLTDVTVTDGTTINFTLSGQNITAETIDSAINHDALSNFVAAEHVDWAGASAGTIHATNYVDNNTTDHTLFSNIGTNSHTAIDTHIALTSEHLNWTVDQGATNISNTNVVATYSTITANDAGTNITAAELEELTDGSSTTLHSHAGGSGSMTTVKEAGVQLGGADIVTLDFDGTDFDLTETPNTEVNIVINNSGIDHDATTNFLAAEHVDWALASQGTIHATNYVDNNTTDHTAFSNIGTNSHAAIDTHIADTTDAHTVSSDTLTFTNKTFDANATGNALSNVDVADLANGTDGELITWSSTGVAATVAVGTSTHVLTSNGVGVAPTFQAGGGGGGLLPWTEVTGTTQQMAVDNGYIANNSSLVTLTLPATAVVGSVLSVAGKGIGLWRVAQNAGDIIHQNDLSTTTGTGGRIDSATQWDSVSLVCIVADNEWVLMSDPTNGGLTFT